MKKKVNNYPHFYGVWLNDQVNDVVRAMGHKAAKFTREAIMEKLEREAKNGR